jgi:hypothetical protein
MQRQADEEREKAGLTRLAPYLQCNCLVHNTISTLRDSRITPGHSDNFILRLSCKIVKFKNEV